jgi:hypothetical protein
MKKLGFNGVQFLYDHQVATTKRLPENKVFILEEVKNRA